MELVRRSGAALRSAKGTFGVLGVRDYLWYWIASFAYYTGFHMDTVGRGWLAYDMSGSALLLGVVTASQGLPQSVIALIGGLVADRASKRGVIMAAQLVLAFTGFATAVLITAGLIQLYQVALLALLQGVAVGFSLPGRLAFVSDIVSREQFLRAYGLYYIALNTMRIVAPAAGGLLISIIGTGGIFYVIGTAHFLAFFSLLFVSQSGAPAPNKQQGSVVHDFVEMFSYARRNGIIPILMGLEVFIGFFGQSIANIMPVFAVSVFKVGSPGLGALMAALGIGALLGSLVVASVGNFRRKPLLLLAIGVVDGMAVILFAVTPVFMPALFFAGAAGFAAASYMTLNSTLFQLNATDELRSRVMSLYMLGNAFAPVALLPLGGAADLMGASTATALNGGLLVSAMVCSAILLPKFRRLEM